MKEIKMKSSSHSIYRGVLLRQAAIFKFSLVTLFCCFISTSLIAQWNKQIIDSNLLNAYELDVADLNGDGYLDIIASGNAAFDICWYEGPNWTKHYIDSNLEGAGDVIAYDIDDDDTLDVLAGSGGSMDDVVWYKGPDPNWAKNYIHRNLNGTIHLAIGDMDNDGDFDIVAAGVVADSVVWFENPSWYRRHIGVINYPRKVKVADINKDGTLDVICTGINEDAVV